MAHTCSEAMVTGQVASWWMSSGAVGCAHAEAAVLDLRGIDGRLLGLEMGYGAKPLDPQLDSRLS